MQPAKAFLLTGGFDEALLLAPAQAIALYVASVPAPELRVERVDLDAAFGRVLAEDVPADADYPRAARSSMDGFARAGGAAGRFRLSGEVRMGAAFAGAVGTGEAVRIPTGGVLPAGTDAVVPLEDATVEGDLVDLPAVPPGDCVTPQGSDLRAGAIALQAGRRIGAPELGVLATLGVVAVPVFARPRIAVLSSGDEIVAPDRTPAPEQIRDSNRYAIAASLRAMGAEPVHGPTVADEPGALEAALREALATCDGAMLSGGSSVGERDLTPGAIAALGPAGIVVHGLRIKPGKPTVLGASGSKPVIGLPGNPVSALIVLEAIVAPLVARLTGATAPAATVEATLSAPVRGRPGWTTYVPVAVEDEGAHVAAHPLALHSSLVSLPARASGYCEVGEDDAPLEAGTRVTVRRFLSGGLR